MFIKSNIFVKMNYILILLFTIFSLLISNCGFHENDNTEIMNDNSKIYTGKIIKVNFVDKGGRVHKDIFSYFFETEGDKIFIKITEGKVNREEIAKYYNEEIKVRAIKTGGLWDTDDPNVQSRVGDYIIFKEILTE